MKTAMVGLMLLPLLLVACGDTGGDGDPAASSKAVMAAGIADEIAASPEQMEAILTKHGMTMQEFEDLIYEITEDPEMSEAFIAARKVPTTE